MGPWSYPTTEITLGTYEEVAPEYYDPVRHPTCANFRKASCVALEKCLSHLKGPEFICEIGAGKSVVVELCKNALHRVMLVDSSPSMLMYSRQWHEWGVRSFVAEASGLGFLSENIDVMVASLGDPYNAASFWQEASRVLKPGGSIFFTTPSFDWACAFRTKHQHALAAAQFELRNGRTLYLPSTILSVQEQIRLIERSGLRLEDVEDVPVSELRGQPLSPKLMLERGAQAPVVTCYTATKGSNAAPNTCL